MSSSSSPAFPIEPCSQKEVDSLCHICDENQTFRCTTYVDIYGVKGVVGYCRYCISDQDVYELDAVSVKEAQDFLDGND